MAPSNKAYAAGRRKAILAAFGGSFAQQGAAELWSLGGYDV